MKEPDNRRGSQGRWRAAYHSTRFAVEVRPVLCLGSRGRTLHDRASPVWPTGPRSPAGCCWKPSTRILQRGPFGARFLAADFAQKYSIRYQGIERRVRFEPLPGVEHEARDVAEKLRVKPRLGDGATGAELFTRRRGCLIVHLATHGLLDETDPEASFVALADGPLTAQQTVPK